jgi:hypothetical protein
MHFVAFNGIRDARLEDVPTHMFVATRMLRPNINTAGWHVAHIFNAKDRQTDWQNWSREQLARRFLRNLHPCNCFYIPNPVWRQVGGDPQVIGFMAARYRERYGDVWQEFVEAVRGEALPEGDGLRRIVYAPEVHMPAVHAPAVEVQSPAASPSDGAVKSYRASRLTFRADVIEPLPDEQSFEVVTPVGRFRMSKGEFYAAFPGVVASRSYREGRIYYYPTVPVKARRFSVGDE